MSYFYLVKLIGLEETKEYSLDSVISYWKEQVKLIEELPKMFNNLVEVYEIPSNLRKVVATILNQNKEQLIREQNIVLKLSKTYPNPDQEIGPLDYIVKISDDFPFSMLILFDLSSPFYLEIKEKQGNQILEEIKKNQTRTVPSSE